MIRGNRNKFWELPEDALEGILSVLQLPNAAKILDIGCGTGSLCARLSKRGFDVTGIDRHSESIATARKNLGTAANFSLVVLKDYKPSARFDLSIFMLSLAFIDDKLQALHTARALSKRSLVITPVRKSDQQLGQRQRIISIERKVIIESSTRAGFTRMETLKTFSVEKLPIEVILLT